MSGTLARLSGNKDQALQDALGHLAPDARTVIGAARTRPGAWHPRAGQRRQGRHRRAPHPGPSRPLRALARRRRRAPDRGARRARHRAALHAPGRGDRPCAGGPARRRRHADRVRQDAVLQRRRPQHGAARAGRARALPVPDQGARAGPAGGTAGTGADRRRGRAARDRRVHLRRRHARRRTARDQGARQRGAQQPGHAACRRPAAPSALGPPVREPPLHRHRRTARVSRRVRQPPGQRPAPAAAHLPSLRVESDVHLHVGHDRQSEGAGRATHRAAVRARRREWRPAGREVLRAAEPAGRQPGARHPPFVPRRKRAAWRSSSCAGTCS